MADALVAIWTRQYCRPRDIGERVHYTDERLTKMVNDAYQAGYRDGAQEHLYKVRGALDEAKVDLSRVRFPDLPR